jgi:monoterpene epsilon-lactone hydrolase
MASEEFYRILQTLRQMRDSSAHLRNEFDLEYMRTTMNFNLDSVPESARISKVDAGGVLSEWIRGCDTHPDHRMLYLHGGGYVAGGLISHRPLVARISKASGCSILLLDYRLAPEHRFPAALNDALSAFRWMADNGPGGQRPATRSFIAGDSAGGGLTLATLLALIEAGDDLPDAAVTLSAWTDLALTGESIRTNAALDPILNPRLMPDMASAYLGGIDPRTPLASPLFGDLARFSPLLLQVGEAEILHDDSVRFATKARTAGVQVTLEIWPEMFHVWQAFSSQFPEAQEAIDRIGMFIRSFF